jgi:Fe-S-cluster containining protein
MGDRVIEFPAYDAVVPFVCHRCGNCCRGFYPAIDMDILPESAAATGMSIAEIQTELARRCVAHNADRPMDCLFLAPGGDGCLIDAVRPDCCQMFPALTETGRGKVDCPGHKEFHRVVKGFPQAKEARVRKATHLRQPRRIPENKWAETLLVLKKAGASDMLVGQFVLVNKR